MTAALYEWLLFLHVVAAMAWVGGTLVISVLVAVVLRSPRSEDIARFVRSLRVVGPAVLAPATILLPALGIWMVVDSDAWDFEQTWVWLGLALYAAAFVFGAGFQSRAAIGAERAAKAGDDGEALRRLRAWSWGSRVIGVLLLVATWDMVFKPGL
jgi:uncharacterized membrane protein